MNHFYMPNDENKIETEYNQQKDDGYFGIGIYATDNFYYASMYQNVFKKELSSNEKLSVFCCSTIYDNKQLVEAEDCEGNLEKLEIEPKNYGVHHALVGSINNYHMIKNEDIDNAKISAEKFVFGNKYQIIPVISFSITKANFFVLWIDENNKYSKEYKDLKHEIKENIYYFNSKEKYGECVDKKKCNKMKLIISYNDAKWGIDIINEIKLSPISCASFFQMMKIL